MLVAAFGGQGATGVAIAPARRFTRHGRRLTRAICAPGDLYTRPPTTFLSSVGIDVGDRPSPAMPREANAWSASALSAGGVAGDRRSDRAIAFAD
jgi:hypothetical protein